MEDVRVRKLTSEFSLDRLASIVPSDQKKLTIAEAMALAIYIAYQGAQRVSPNPLVGCVILDQNGCFLSKGYHQVYGSAHAEINALEGLDTEHLQNATIVVTLEPCAHVGQTGSCALRIKDLPIKKVVYGVEDPNPLVSGKGAQIIRDSGKEVVLFSSLIDPPNALNPKKVGRTFGHMIIDQLEILSESFFKNFRFKKSFVALKWAQSLDGKLALRSFESQWITNELSRNYSHYLRSIYDVTIVGARTVLTDNPKLNIRLAHFSKENKIMIIDPKGAVFKALDSLEISNTHNKENIYFVVDANDTDAAITFKLSSEAPSSFNNVLFLKRDGDGNFPLDDIHKFCFDRKMNSILVEGGPSTLNQYFKQNAFDRTYAFIAPVFLGGGLGYTDELLVSTMADTVKLKSIEKLELGDDILITGVNTK